MTTFRSIATGTRLSTPCVTPYAVRDLLNAFLPHISQDDLLESYCQTLNQLQHVQVCEASGEAGLAVGGFPFQSHVLQLQLHLLQVRSITKHLGNSNLLLLCFACDALHRFAPKLGAFCKLLRRVHQILFAALFVRMDLRVSIDQSRRCVLPYVLADDLLKSSLQDMQKQAKELSAQRALIQASRDKNKLLLLRRIMKSHVNILKNCFAAWAKLVSDNKRQFAKIALVFDGVWKTKDSMRWYFSEWVKHHNAVQFATLGKNIASRQSHFAASMLNVEATKKRIFEIDFAITSLDTERRAVIKRIEMAIARSKELKLAQTSLQSQHLTIKKRILTWRSIAISQSAANAATAEPVSKFAMELRRRIQLDDLESFEITQTMLAAALEELKPGHVLGHEKLRLIGSQLAQLAVQRRAKGAGSTRSYSKVYKAAMEMCIADEEELLSVSQKPMAILFLIDLIHTKIRDAHRRHASAHSGVGCGSHSTRALDVCFQELSSHTDRILNDDDNVETGKDGGRHEFQGLLQQASKLLLSSDAHSSASSTLASLEDDFDKAAWICFSEVMAEDDTDFQGEVAFAEMVQSVLDELEGHITFKHRLKGVLVGAKLIVEAAKRNYSYPLRHGLHDLAQDVGMPSTIVKHVEDVGSLLQWEGEERTVDFLVKAALHKADEEQDPANVIQYEELVVEALEELIETARAKQHLSGQLPTATKSELRGLFNRELQRNVTARGFLAKDKWLALLEQSQLLDFRFTESMAEALFDDQVEDRRGLGFTQFTNGLICVAKRAHRSPFLPIHEKLDKIIHSIKH